jgi:hypothetical protein
MACRGAIHRAQEGMGAINGALTSFRDSYLYRAIESKMRLYG